MTTLLHLPVSQLNPHPLNKNVRGQIDPESADIVELAESIAERGVQTPLAVEKNGNGYYVLQGERRYWACQIVARQSPDFRVPCVPLTPTDNLDRLIGMGTENIKRKNLTPLAEARYYQSLLDEGLPNATAVARALKVPPGRVISALRLLEFGPEAQQAFDKKLVSANDSVLRALLRIPNQEARTALIKKAAETGRPGHLIERDAVKLCQALGVTESKKRPGPKKKLKAKDIATGKPLSQTPHYLRELIKLSFAQVCKDAELFEKMGSRLFELGEFALGEVALNRHAELLTVKQGVLQAQESARQEQERQAT